MANQTPPPHTKAAPLLAMVQSRLAALSALDLPEKAGALVAQAADDLRALQAVLLMAPPTDIDMVVFEQLLSLAGPKVTPELLSQLQKDLTVIAEALPAALEKRDWAVVRAQTHVLMALAGSVGARSVQEASLRLNRAAHGADPSAEELGRQTLAGLAALRGFIHDACLRHPFAADTGIS